MRRIDIVLALLFVALVLGLIFVPEMISRWRADDAAKQAIETPAPVEEPPVTEPRPQPAVPSLSPEAELERVSGILMLHQACASRFDDFDARARPLLETWKRQHADTLARRGEELDFHIVLGTPEGREAQAVEKAREEQRALCERNLEAMRADIEETSSNPAPQVD